MFVHCCRSFLYQKSRLCYFDPISAKHVFQKAIKQKQQHKSLLRAFSLGDFWWDSGSWEFFSLLVAWQTAGYLSIIFRPNGWLEFQCWMVLDLILEVFGNSWLGISLFDLVIVSTISRGLSGRVPLSISGPWGLGNESSWLGSLSSGCLLTNCGQHLVDRGLSEDDCLLRRLSLHWLIVT